MVDTYKVYVRTDADGNVISVVSSAFVSDTADWTQIDEGVGDRYHHAQGNYFDKSITTDLGAYRYMLSNGAVTEKSAAKIEAEETAVLTAWEKTAQIDALKAQLAATDYKIIKAYEYSLAGLPAPYDVGALHAERQALRDEINLIEQTNV